MKKYIVHITFLFLILSCEEKKELEIQSVEIPRLVINGMITNERTSHKVTLSLPVKDLNETSQPVSNALVAITDQENVFILSEDPDKPGTYLTQPDVQGVLGKVYTLYIRLLNFEFIASSYMVPVESLREPVIQPCGNMENYYHIIPRESGEPYMMRITGDLSSTADCKGNDECYSFFNFYHLNSLDVNEIFFKPDKEQVCFPAGTLITREKFSLNPQHQEFIRSLMMETEWRGGIFDVEPGNVITNISAGGIGYFAASTVVRDSFILE